MKHHWLERTKHHNARIHRRATMVLFAAAVCGLSTSLVAKQPNAPAPSTAAFNAVAVHQDYVGIWMTAGASSEKVAQARALELCARDTGTDTCQIAYSSQRNYLAAGYAIDGGLEFLAQNEPAGLTEALEAKCTGRFGSTCMVVGMVGPDGVKDFPVDPVPAPRRRFAAVAGDFTKWVKNLPSNWRVWVFAGVETREAAQLAAMSACEKEIGRDRCQIAEANGDSVLLFYQGKGADFAGFLAEKSADRALAEMNRRCRLASRDCEVITMVQAQQPGQHVLDLGAFSEFETGNTAPGSE